jgi:hypothetical protein
MKSTRVICDKCAGPIRSYYPHKHYSLSISGVMSSMEPTDLDFCSWQCLIRFGQARPSGEKTAPITEHSWFGQLWGLGEKKD